MRRLTSRLAVLAVVAVASPIPRAAAEAVTVIRAGRLVDVEKGEIRRDQIVVVRGSSAGNHSTFGILGNHSICQGMRGAAGLEARSGRLYDGFQKRQKSRDTRGTGLRYLKC